VECHLLLFFIGFIVLMNSLQVAFERKINTALKEINENEISYLEKPFHLKTD
jgi:hypothetical protein